MIFADQLCLLRGCDYKKEDVEQFFLTLVSEKTSSNVEFSLGAEGYTVQDE